MARHILISVYGWTSWDTSCVFVCVCECVFVTLETSFTHLKQGGLRQLLIDCFRCIDWDKKCIPVVLVYSFFFQASLAPMILLYVVVLPCIRTSFYSDFRCFNVSSVPSSIHPSIHSSFNLLRKGRVIDQWDSLNFQIHPFIHLPLLSSSMSSFCPALPFVVSFHLRSPGCGSKPPVRRRGCRGATG